MFEKEPTKEGTSASVKGMNTTSLKLDVIMILFVMVSYVAEYESVLPPLSKRCLIEFVLHWLILERYSFPQVFQFFCMLCLEA